jgi:hypothetical protein
MKPRRFQRKHFRARKPPGSAGVARPSRFGNPFDVATYGSAAACVRLFKEQYEHDSVYRAEVVRRLCGKDLWCYCALDAPCHADVLLAWANDPVHVTYDAAHHPQTRRKKEQSAWPG